MTVYAVDPLKDPRWPELLQTHPRASVFHGVGWLAALRNTYGYEPVVYTTCGPSANLTNGIVVCRIRSWLTGRRMVSLPFADHCDPLVDSPQDLEGLVAGLCRTVVQEKWDYLEMRPTGSDFSGEPSLEPSHSFRLHVLDLRLPLDDLFRVVHKTAIQQTIRRAEREAVEYEEGNSEELLEKFYRLLVLTRRRHRVPPQPIRWFRNLIGCLGDCARISVASKDRRPIAGILTLRHRDSLVYKYGGSDADSHHLGAIPFLLWKAIEEAKHSGSVRFDLGRSDTDNHGLVTFKDRWGAARSTLTYVRYSTHRPRIATMGSCGMRTARWVCARMPDTVFTAAGKLLYRHIG